MFLRIEKFIAHPNDGARLENELHHFMVEVLRKQKGSRRVYLKQEVGLASKFFLQSTWDSLADLQATDQLPASSELYKRLLPLLQERKKGWDLKLLDEDARPIDLKDEKPYIRLIRLHIKEGTLKSVIELYYKTAVNFRQMHVGCLKVQLYQDTQVDNIIFLESWWSTEADLRKMLQSNFIRDIRLSVNSYFEQRMDDWTLKLSEVDTLHLSS